MSSAANPPADVPRLRRSLSLWDLILYGVIVIQPVAPMRCSGCSAIADMGTWFTTILIAMVAMLFTAISYGRMARAYPARARFSLMSAGNNPALVTSLAGSMVMDYMLNPIICTIWCSQQAHYLLRACRTRCGRSLRAGVYTPERAGSEDLGPGELGRWQREWAVVIAIFFVVAGPAISSDIRTTAGFYTRPFYDPSLWNTRPCSEVHRLRCLPTSASTASPRSRKRRKILRRNILLATVLTCVVDRHSVCGRGLRRAC